jgi:hypothetical protein
MPGIFSVAHEFKSFADYLGKEFPEKVESIGETDNGVEGWLKIEFFLWLTNYRKEKLLPRDDEDRDVGLEYDVLLDQRQRHPVKRETKRCDLYIRDSSRASSFHYVELKVPFANQNRGKVLASAACDFWYMKRIRRACEQPSSGNVIVFGVGFDDEAEWERCMQSLQKESDSVNEAVLAEGPSVLGSKRNLRWCVLTFAYPPGRQDPRGCPRRRRPSPPSALRPAPAAFAGTPHRPA